MLEKASQWLRDKIKTSASNVIVYKTGLISISLAASRQKTTYEVVDHSGLIVKVDSHDFVVDAADLVDGSTKLIPKSQDTIEVTDTTAGVKHVFEVQALSQPNGSRELAYRPCDPWGHQLRIFTFFKESQDV
jgi:hypothetical protein